MVVVWNNYMSWEKVADSVARQSNKTFEEQQKAALLSEEHGAELLLTEGALSPIAFLHLMCKTETAYTMLQRILKY